MDYNFNMTTFTKDQITKWNQELAGKSVGEIVKSVFERVPASDHSKIVMTSAFNQSDMYLFHEARKIKKDIPVMWIETGYHFEETKKYVQEMKKKFDMNLVILYPELSRVEFEKKNGGPIHDDRPDECCHANKVVPLQNALKNKNVWFTALRRDQSESRRNIDIIELYRDDLIKVNALAAVTAKEVYYYLKDNGIPEHPLIEQGYISVGCSPESCTSKVFGDVSGERAGRWKGKNKIECGLHTFMPKK
jgi:phosphoadenosine phosphosulfate reductase